MFYRSNLAFPEAYKICFLLTDFSHGHYIPTGSNITGGHLANLVHSDLGWTIHHQEFCTNLARDVYLERVEINSFLNS